MCCSDCGAVLPRFSRPLTREGLKARALRGPQGAASSRCAGWTQSDQGFGLVPGAGLDNAASYDHEAPEGPEVLDELASAGNLRGAARSTRGSVALPERKGPLRSGLRLSNLSQLSMYSMASWQFLLSHLHCTRHPQFCGQFVYPSSCGFSTIIQTEHITSSYPCFYGFLTLNRTKHTIDNTKDAGTTSRVPRGPKTSGRPT